MQIFVLVLSGTRSFSFSFVLLLLLPPLHHASLRLKNWWNCRISFCPRFLRVGGDGKRWSNWTFCWFVCLCTNFECYMLILFELKANANTNFSTIWWARCVFLLHLIRCTRNAILIYALHWLQCICLVAINFLFYNHHRWNANAKWAESAFSNQTDEICNPQAIKKSTWHVRRTHSRFAVLRSLQENNRLFIYWISFCLQRLLLSFSSSFVLFCFHYISETSVFFRVSEWSSLVWSGHHPVSE